MNQFNTYISGIDAEYFKSLCLKYGEMRIYKKGDYLVRIGEVYPCWGYIQCGIIKYTCYNVTEDKTYNVGFSFSGEFVADYPNCLYHVRSELNIQAVSQCKIWICSSDVLIHSFEENQQNQYMARIAAENLFLQSYARYLDFYRLTPEERYRKLIAQCPELFNLVPLKEIASYLKVTPTHLSRIRKKMLTGQ